MSLPNYREIYEEYSHLLEQGKRKEALEYVLVLAELAMEERAFIAQMAENDGREILFPYWRGGWREAPDQL